MTESTQRSETGTQQPKATTAQPGGNEEGATLDEFRRLLADESGESPKQEASTGRLNGDAGESQQHAKPQGEPEKPKGKPKALKDLAERLELQPEDLYAIEVPLGGDGKTVKLSELKDAFAKQDDLSVRELKLEESRAKQEAEYTRANQELQTLLSQLDPKAITPEVREKVKARIDEGLKRERAETLRVIPEWQDEAVRDKELAGMVEHLKDFGIPSNFLTATMSHKLFRFVRDAWQRKVRVERALTQVETVKKPSTTGKSKPNGAAKLPQATPAKRSTDLRSRFPSVLRQG